MLRPLVLAGCLGVSACHFQLGSHDMRVDGVRLPAHHQEVLTLASWPAEGLVIAAHQGDVRVEPGEGELTITVEVHERELGEAHAHMEGGRLVVRARGDGACAIGDVVVHAPAAGGPGLQLSTGMGDVELRGVAVTGKLGLSTGMGDVDLHGTGQSEEIELESGMGDISALHLACTRFRAETGMGDVRVEGLEASEVRVASGMGDVEVVRSRGQRVKAETGLGDVELRESNFATRELESGLGSVRGR